MALVGAAVAAVEEEMVFAAAAAAAAAEGGMAFAAVAVVPGRHPAQATMPSWVKAARS